MEQACQGSGLARSQGPLKEISYSSRDVPDGAELRFYSCYVQWGTAVAPPPTVYVRPVLEALKRGQGRHRPDMHRVCNTEEEHEVDNDQDTEIDIYCNQSKKFSGI